MVWQSVRESKDCWWAGLGVQALVIYGFTASMQPDANFGRILAAYGGVIVAGPLAWRPPEMFGHVAGPSAGVLIRVSNYGNRQGRGTNSAQGGGAHHR
jgi:drug/metabolite transporter superfamily protein YnfA